MAEVMKIAISTITFTLKKTNEGDMWQKNKRLFSFYFIKYYYYYLLMEIT